MVAVVQNHYGSTDIVGRILSAVPWSRKDGKPLTADQLFPFDQLHGRELLATREHAAKLNPARNSHLLDVGSGIGGPARYFASVFGCRVTGIDLTPEFVVAATELTALTNLGDRIAFVEADAANLPFDDMSFDHACSFYVGMNLPDKPAVLDECFRVLQPGATMIWTEVASCGDEPHYPLPWSRTADASHLVTRDTLVAAVSGVGFEVESVDDETEAHLELARKMGAAAAPPPIEKQQANEVVLGADFMERRRNYIRSLAEGTIASIVVLARKGKPRAAT